MAETLPASSKDAAVELVDTAILEALDQFRETGLTSAQLIRKVRAIIKKTENYHELFPRGCHHDCIILVAWDLAMAGKIFGGHYHSEVVFMPDVHGWTAAIEQVILKLLERTLYGISRALLEEKAVAAITEMRIKWCCEWADSQWLRDVVQRRLVWLEENKKIISVWNARSSQWTTRLAVDSWLFVNTPNVAVK